MARTKNFDRQQKLTAAMGLFWQQGYAQTSVSDLVSHLAINRFSLYNTYGDKLALYQEALDKYLQTIALPAVSALRDHNSSFPQLLTFLEHFVQLQRKQHCGCFLQNAILERAPSDEYVLQISDQFFDSLTQAFCFTLTNAINRGEIDQAVSPIKTSRFLAMQMQGIRVLGKAKQYQTMDDGVYILFDYLQRLKVSH